MCGGAMRRRSKNFHKKWDSKKYAFERSRGFIGFFHKKRLEFKAKQVYCIVW